MKQRLPYVLVALIISIALAQAQVLDFGLPANACRNESIEIDNLSSGIADFSWDFCEGELLTAMTESAALQINEIDQAAGIRTVRDGSVYYSLVIDRGTNSLKLVNFGTSLSNQPTVTTVSLPGGMTLVSPQGLYVMSSSAGWHVFISSTGNNKIYRLDFGSSLINNPAAVELNFSGALNIPIEIEAVKDGADFFLTVINFSGNNLVVANLGNSITNQPQSVTAVALAGASSPYGFSLKKFADGKWRGVVGSFGNGNIHTVNFDNGLALPPLVTNITTEISPIANPVKLSLETWGDQSTLFVMSASGFVTRAVFTKGTLLDEVASSAVLNATSLGAPLSFSLFYDQGDWMGMTFSNATRHFRILTFEDNCTSTVDLKFFQGATPPFVEFATDGPKAISLISVSDGFIERITKEVTINDLPAPQIDITAMGACENVAIDFSVTSSMPLSSYDWDFGDNTTSSEDAPSHVYTAGSFTVGVIALAANGCSNRSYEELTVYSKPVASFGSPLGLICTNNVIEFQNSTPGNYQGLLQYEWFVDELPVSEERDLHHLFENPGIHVIKMVAKIPGCSDEKNQNTSAVQAGPAVNFMYEGNCEDQDIRFTQQILEPVESYFWNFDDGATSNSPNPVHTFASHGTYEVLLTASSANGCNNSKTYELTINDSPSADFSTEGPPSSCSGYATSFTDLTPALASGQIEFWQWNFGDAATDDVKNPTHTFQNAGDYNVELTVMSDQGCANSITKSVTIFQSPDINFTNSSSCLNKPTTLTAISANASQFFWEVGTAYYETQSVDHVFASAGIHPVKLIAVASNQCVSTLSKDVIVPEAIVPTFTVMNNCRGNHAAFTMTATSTDPIASQLWNFSGEGADTEKNPSFVFFTPGSKNISLQLTTQSGCVYQTQKIIQVIEPPVSQFSFTPAFGVPPQEFSFTNESKDAAKFEWNFGDGSRSADFSPKHTFTELGDYVVELTATNTIGCEHITGATISLLAPLPDVDLSLITITPNADGTLKVIVTISNKGNTILKNLPVKVDVSGNLTLETIVQEPIVPFSQYNLVLNYGIAQRSDLEFLCASAMLEGDLHPEGNRICNQLSANVAIITPHPNPVSDYLKVEWIAAGNELVDIVLIDSSGKKVVEEQVESTSGLNEKFIDLRNQRSGIYLLKVSSATGSQTHRILVSN